jgi:hypothetical protein
MANIEQGKSYYDYEVLFKSETEKYLSVLRELERTLQGRRKEFSINLCHRINLIVSILESDLIRSGHQRKN